MALLAMSSVFVSLPAGFVLAAGCWSSRVTHVHSGTLILSFHGYGAGNLSVEGLRNEDEVMPGNVRLGADRWCSPCDFGFLFLSRRFSI